MLVMYPSGSRTVMSHARRTCSTISGFSGSPAASASRSGGVQRLRSSWMIMRQTVGGAQNVVTWQRTSWSSSAAALKRVKLKTITVASASHGAYTLLHACLAHPGEDRFTCTSPGWIPAQYMVDRCPSGYEAWLCSTSLGFAVVPEVKYRSSGSEAAVGPSGANAVSAPSA